MSIIINGEKIEDSVIRHEFERLRPDYEKAFSDQSPDKQKKQLLEWSKENVIEKLLVRQYAKKHGSAIAQADVESALVQIKEQYQGRGQSAEELSDEDEKKIKADIELQMKIEQVMQDVCKDIPEPSQGDVQAYYDENKEQFKAVEQVRVAHIVKHINWQTDEAAAHNAIKKACDELQTDVAFELLVDKYSDCTDNGGDLGYITKGQMVEEFEDVVFNLGPGQVSEVFRTRFGFHIAKVYDKKPTVFPGIEEAKEPIANMLMAKAKDKAFEEFVDRLRSNAEIQGL